MGRYLHVVCRISDEPSFFLNLHIEIQMILATLLKAFKPDPPSVFYDPPTGMLLSSSHSSKKILAFAADASLVIPAPSPPTAM